MSKDDRVGKILVGRYRTRRPIGAGAHGRVYLAEDLGRGGVHVAFKVVEEIVGGAKRDEADDLLRWFRHPNWADVTDGGPLGEEASFQVTRYVPGKSLDKVEDAQPANLVWRFLEDGARVLGALHRQGLIHYDVTPGNWLLHRPGGKPQFVLTDGGLAHVGAVSGFARGTPQYMAPEVTESGTHDHRADLYSLGLVAFRLATGRDPIEGGGGDVLGRRRREDAPRASKFNPDVPPALDDLLADLLARDPNARPHDAFALLERIGTHVERDVPPISDDEGIASAGGGPLVGCDEELARFQDSLDVLVQRIPLGGRSRAPRPAPVVKDAVLVLKGAPGSGTTRLAAEMTARTRNAEVPVAVMSGRETATDRRGPLRHLVDGVSALGLKEGEEAETVALELDSDGVGLEERSHATGRAIEQFVSTVEAAAKRTPFVLVIEDFADLPERARKAVTVLSRHLLSRRESSGGTSALAMTMVVDAGSGQHEDLLIPDAPDPEHPVLELAALGSDALQELCTTRFPGLECDAADLEKVERVSEGRPGTLVSLLGEACRRGDLRSESGRWLWNVDEIEHYEIERGLSPVDADALRRADDRLRELLRYLSLVDSPVGEDVVRRLWDRGEPLPATPLIQTWTHEDTTHHALANLAVRKAVQRHGSMDEWAALRERLVDALATAPVPALALDRARLNSDLGAHTETLRVLEESWRSLSSEARSLAQPLVARAVEEDAGLLASAESRRRIAGLLEFGAGAVPIAQALAAEISPKHDALETAEVVSEVLENRRHNEDALNVLLPFGEAAELEPRDGARLWSQIANLQFELQRQSEGTESLAHARRFIRQLRKAKQDHAPELARYLMTESRPLFLEGRTWRARWNLGATLRATTSTSTGLRVQALNNLGIVCQQAGEGDLARQHFEASLEARKVLGDVEGVIKTTINLGRLAQFDGELVKSASLYQSAASVALRHAQYFALVNALRALAGVYDQQLNSRLASATLQRAVTVGRRVGYEIGVLAAAWELAPLAATIGDRQVAQNMLLSSAIAARSRKTEYARGTHALVSVLTNLHMGLHDRAAMYVPRLLRHQSALFMENQLTVDSMLPLLTLIHGPLGVRSEHGRPPPGKRTRFLFRARTWLERALRGRPATPVLPLRRFVPEIGRRPSAPGRDRRVLIEMALLAARTHPESAWDATLNQIERHLAHTGEKVLRARALALSSSRTGSGVAPEQAQRFSRSVDLLGATSADRIPLEHELAVRRHLARGPSLPLSMALINASDLHACAHQMLVASGCTAAPDGRVASALRRVLEATGRINAGAGLDELLEALTQHTTEITGAERACIVLAGQEDELHVRVASGATVGQETFGVEDLSHTVIQRVLASAEPLLLHDVFDDQELMGRPSITSLSLRSILCVPMMRGESLYGVMYADSSSAAGSFDQVDLEVLSLFAEQAAAALETHRLVADLQNSMAELKAMQERLVRGERLRTMGELSSGVAHEFNNLLTSILARVQLIGLSQLDLELRHDLEMIERACLDAAEVVRRLQSYAKQQRQGDFELLDMADICRDSVEFLRPLWSGRRSHGKPPIQVRLRARAGLGVLGNATELREVVTNLVKNALDALGDGGEIAVSAAPGEEEQIIVLVQDDGPGVPKDIQSKIFDPFFTTKGERGTGLGLALSQQIVERHGGALEMESAPGEGTTMRVTLPTAESVEPAQAVSVADEPSPEAVSVVVVDDDENVLLPLCKYLERAGYKAIPARSGDEGLAAVEEHGPDIVISDVGMPGMDGLELCRRLRVSAPDLPVVLMSGWAGSADPPRATQAGAAALLSKPFALRQVSELIDAVRAESG